MTAHRPSVLRKLNKEFPLLAQNLHLNHFEPMTHAAFLYFK